MIQRLTVRSIRDISPSEGHLGVKTIMAAILKGRSKPWAWDDDTEGHFKKLLFGLLHPKGKPFEGIKA